MKKIIRCTLLLIIFFIFFCIHGSAAAPFIDDYVVEPVTPDMDTGTPLETVQVDFWDLPPGIILLAFALSLSSFLGLPLELILSIKLCLYFGYHKLSKSEVFSNDARDRIHTCIRENPGIIFCDIARMTGINRGCISYHLLILKQMHKITALESSGNPGYFENSGMYTEVEKILLKYIRNDKDCRIFRLLMEEPNLNRNSLGKYLDISPSTVSWHIKRLCGENLIITRKAGRSVFYEINPEIRQYLKKYIVLNEDTNRSVTPEQISGII